MVESRSDCIEVGANAGQVEECIEFVVLGVRLWMERNLCAQHRPSKEGSHSQTIVFATHSELNEKADDCVAVRVSKEEVKNRGSSEAPELVEGCHS